MADGVPAFGAYSAMKAAFGGIRPAIVTNGYAWIVFRAIREDMPWRNGLARVFSSIEYIEEHFTEFWNLLSLNQLGKDPLMRDLGLYCEHRGAWIVSLIDCSTPTFHSREIGFTPRLCPIMETIFQSIADQDPLENHRGIKGPCKLQI